MSTYLVKNTEDMFQLQCTLEEAITSILNEFEHATGMSVHSIKVFRTEPVKGRRTVEATEVSAMLR